MKTATHTPIVWRDFIQIEKGATSGYVIKRSNNNVLDNSIWDAWSTGSKDQDSVKLHENISRWVGEEPFHERIGKLRSSMQTVREMLAYKLDDDSISTIPTRPSDGELQKIDLILAESLAFDLASAKGDGIHSSDCAIHNAPADPNQPCDCGVENYKQSLV